MVDPSLLRLAADRGVTICFADLDGADGLWVPEERTVLVNRRLSESEVAEVIEHELGHAAIDDQHADLDAGVGSPPGVSSRRWAKALTVAAGLAIVGGVAAGLARDSDAIKEGPVVAPSARPMPAAPPGPGEVVTTRVVGPDGRILIRTVTRTPTPSGSTPAATSVGRAASTASRPTSAAPVLPPTPSATSPMATTSQPQETTPPPLEPTTPDVTVPSSPAADSGGVLEDEATGTGTASGSVSPPSTS